MHFLAGLAFYSLSALFLTHGCKSLTLASFKEVPIGEDQFEVTETFHGKGQRMSCALLAVVASSANIHMGFSLKDDDCNIGKWRFNSLLSETDTTGAEKAFVPLIDLGTYAWLILIAVKI